MPEKSNKERLQIDIEKYPIRLSIVGQLRITEFLARRAIDWAHQHYYEYDTLEELLRDYFLTFPDEFDTGDITFERL